MITFLKENKKGLIVGLAASAIFVYFIQPILSLLSYLVISGSEIVSNTYTDRIYQQAAHLETYDHSFLLMMILMGTTSILLLGLSILLFSSERLSGHKNHKNKTEDTSKKKTDGKTLIPKSVVAVLFFISASILLSSGVANFIQLSIISSFKQHLRIIAPYISDAEEEIIVSQWSLISSESDYQEIYTKLNNIASDNGIELPENKIYSMLSL